MTLWFALMIRSCDWPVKRPHCYFEREKYNRIFKKKVWINNKCVFPWLSLCVYPEILSVCFQQCVCLYACVFAVFWQSSAVVPSGRQHHSRSLFHCRLSYPFFSPVNLYQHRWDKKKSVKSEGKRSRRRKWQCRYNGEKEWMVSFYHLEQNRGRGQQNKKDKWLQNTGYIKGHSSLHHTELSSDVQYKY